MLLKWLVLLKKFAGINYYHFFNRKMNCDKFFNYSKFNKLKIMIEMKSLKFNQKNWLKDWIPFETINL